MKPSELFKSVYASAIDEGGPYGMTGITFEHAVRDSDKDGVMAEKILALLEAVENTQIWEVRPTSTNTNPLPWLEEHALPGKDEANKQKILWAALALKEATTAKSAAGGHKRASRGDK